MFMKNNFINGYVRLKRTQNAHKYEGSLKK